MTNVFVSGSDVQRDAMAAIAQDLRDLGFRVASRWHDATAQSARHASTDRWFDLMKADMLVVFDMTPQCMIELGAAKALAHRIIGVGLTHVKDDEAAFLPDVENYSDYPTARREFLEHPKALRIHRRDK